MITEVPSTSQPEMESVDFVNLLKKRYKLLIVLPLLSAVIAGIVSFRLPKIYRTKAVLYVVSDEGKAGNLGAFIPGEAFPVGVLSDMFGITQSDYLVALLKSQRAARKVIHKLKLGKNTDFVVSLEKKTPTLQALTETFMKATKVSKDPRTGQVDVYVEGRNPKLIADMANSLVEGVENLIVTKADRNFEFLEEQVALRKKEMTREEEKLRAYQEKHGNVAFSADIEGRMRFLDALEAQEIQAELKLADVNARLQLAGTLEVLAQLRVEKEALDKSLTELRSKIASQERVISSLPEQNLELARITRNLKLTTTIYESLQRDYDMSKLKKARENVVFQVIDKAEPPEKHFKPNKRADVMVGFVSGAFVAIILAFLLEYFGAQRTSSVRPTVLRS